MCWEQGLLGQKLPSRKSHAVHSSEIAAEQRRQGAQEDARRVSRHTAGHRLYAQACQQATHVHVRCSHDTCRRQLGLQPRQQSLWHQQCSVTTRSQAQQQAHTICVHKNKHAWRLANCTHTSGRLWPPDLALVCCDYGEQWVMQVLICSS